MVGSRFKGWLIALWRVFVPERSEWQPIRGEWSDPPERTRRYRGQLAEMKGGRSPDEYRDITKVIHETKERVKP